MTAGAARRAVARLLSEVLGPDQRANASLDARLLVNRAAAVDSNAWVADDLALRPNQLAVLDEMVQRRSAGEPIARILGMKEFWSLPLHLSRETLVPRPETETLVEVALAAVGQRERALTVLDVGTGSGAILLALLSELPLARGIGTDVAPGAVQTARANAALLGLTARAAFVVMNWADALEGGIDLLVANPPYIPTAMIGTLSPEVQVHDPRLALDGGADGLDAHRHVVAAMARLLASGGRGIVEIGLGQAAAVTRLGEAAGLAATAFDDLAGIARVVEFRRR